MTVSFRKPTLGHKALLSMGRQLQRLEAGRKAFEYIDTFCCNREHAAELRKLHRMMEAAIRNRYKERMDSINRSKALKEGLDK